ncbi:hypothetical protein Ait01nite_049520 [Actinoplanes italicus]|uniref:Uncharacterized protein n=1 Tax=Actinoplanes italicus TaxID=113567 RepID=A0A2T0KAA9_9ACTN|nr:hypothetical protein [Actinoplanes italicus]PRX20054.1 hypothetical protein CLV67_109319 [Actinoplanes italicus]GIE31907.1 hypothetical protein Ait01nite_049520 [Actinoplanes italicus]
MSDDISDVASDPRLARVLRSSLTRIADGPDGPMREMAREVLAGRTDLRTALREPAYGEHLGAAFGRFWTDFQAMSPDERDRLVKDTRQKLDEFNQ